MPELRRERGVVLLEVAVAVLVLSIGVLGLLRLQVTAKRAGFEALQRTTASVLVGDILARMRSNSTALSSYDGQVLGQGSIASSPADCKGSDCDSIALATRDLWEWERAIDGAAELGAGGEGEGEGKVFVGGLVNPTGCIDTALDDSVGRVRVTLAWQGYLALSTVNTANICGDESSTQRQLLVVETFIAAG